MSWGTRTRTKNDRTRICSVTITPYPNLFSIAGAKVLLFSECAKILATFFASNVKFVSFSLVLEPEQTGFS